MHMLLISCSAGMKDAITPAVCGASYAFAVFLARLRSCASGLDDTAGFAGSGRWQHQLPHCRHPYHHAASRG